MSGHAAMRRTVAQTVVRVPLGVSFAELPEDAGEGCLDSLIRFDFPSQIYEKQVKTTLSQHHRIQPPSLADAPLEQVAVDRPLEATLGHGDHHPGKILILAGPRPVIDLERILEDHRPLLQQGVNIRLAAEDMALGKNSRPLSMATSRPGYFARYFFSASTIDGVAGVGASISMA